MRPFPAERKADSPETGATHPKKTYFFLWRRAFNCFFRLCLAIFFRRFFFKLPIVQILFLDIMIDNN
jgi:hypothetical protein